MMIQDVVLPGYYDEWVATRKVRWMRSCYNMAATIPWLSSHACSVARSSGLKYAKRLLV